MNFIDALDMNGVSVTENGMVGYNSTGNAYLDFLYKISSLRGCDVEVLETEFTKLFNSAMLNKTDSYLLRFFLYIRDPRNGLGERTVSRWLIKTLFRFTRWENKEECFTFLLNKLYDYGRWDDLLYIFCPSYSDKYNKYFVKVCHSLKETLDRDLELMKKGKPITLLAKWMPSINTSSENTKSLAYSFIKVTGMSEKKYRKTLSLLRNYLKVTERQMSLNEWKEIDYEKVPSLANLRYKDAFLRHDEERRLEYLNTLSKGKAKINSSVNFPHDVVHKYSNAFDYDETIEQLWKNLKDIPGLKDTLVVRDDSGSMTSTIGNTKITALEIATALGIYCAEHCNDAYKNKIISFSENPKYLDFSEYTSLHDKLVYLSKHCEVANTNIEKVFQLILNTAISNNLKQEDLPKQILIISDMEFDASVDYTSNVFVNAQKEYEKYRYKLPKLIFWNINSRTKTIPITQNELGVYLLSGFSPNVLNILSYGLDNQFEALITLLDEKYSEVPLVNYSH